MVEIGSPKTPVMHARRPNFSHAPVLLADVGGTNARFALEIEPGRIEHVCVLPCAAYASLSAAMLAYLSLPQISSAAAGGIRTAGIAIANPVEGDEIRMTNHSWAFSIEAVRREFGFDTLLIVNDFKALAMALPRLAPGQTLQVGGGVPQPQGVMGLLGAGTGLGVSALVPCGSQWVALDTEGGHVSFAPSNEIEMEILRFAWQEHPHVSAERLLSGIGLELIYRALAHRAEQAPQPMPVPEILRRGLARECAVCVETIEHFCAMLGTIAANLAVTLGARGGIYVGGGIVPRLGERFVQSAFRARFESKGRFSDYLARIPTYVITAQYPAFAGVSAMLADTPHARK